jgi:hypothetical protein
MTGIPSQVVDTSEKLQFAVRELFWTHGSILAASPLSLRTKSIQIHPVGKKKKKEYQGIRRLDRTLGQTQIT